MKIDDSFLQELGLGSVPEGERDRMIVDIEDTLASRVGARAEAALGEDKMDEFEGVAKGSKGNYAVIEAWLNSNLPEYKQIRDEEVAKIKQEIQPQVAAIVAQFAPPQTGAS